MLHVWGWRLVRLIRCVCAAAVSVTGELRESVPPSLGEASSPCSKMGSSKRNPPAPGQGDPKTAQKEIAT